MYIVNRKDSKSFTLPTKQNALSEKVASPSPCLKAFYTQSISIVCLLATTPLSNNLLFNAVKQHSVSDNSMADTKLNLELT
jgi:hypothetical protein